ncbi:MAG TPA: chemotaxis protein CheW [Polyangiaceae bacterium]
MKGDTREVARTLREAFDRSFAEPSRPRPPRTGVLAIRVGGDPYGVRLGDVDGLHRDKPVLRTPSGFSELLGLSGFRGAALPVYDLAALLGYPRAATPRWLVVAKGTPRIAFAFEAFEAHLGVERSELLSDAGSSTRPHLDGALPSPDGTRALIRIASLVEMIMSRARPTSPVKER